MRRLMMGLLAMLTALPLLSAESWAQDRRREERRIEEHRAEERFHDRNIARFGGRDFDVWRRGGWIHGNHGGRFGWWWVVDGSWYFYPQPVYPYPDPYIPPVAEIPAAPPGVTYWYYCRNPQGYYPYVPRCVVPWQAVPAR